VAKMFATSRTTLKERVRFIILPSPSLCNLKTTLILCTSLTAILTPTLNYKDISEDLKIILRHVKCLKRPCFANHLLEIHVTY